MIPLTLPIIFEKRATHELQMRQIAISTLKLVFEF